MSKGFYPLTYSEGFKFSKPQTHFHHSYFESIWFLSAKQIVSFLKLILSFVSTEHQCTVSYTNRQFGAMQIFVLLKKSLRFIGFTEFNHPNGAQIASVLRIVVGISTCYLALTSVWFVMFDSPSFVEQARASASVFVHVYCLIQFIVFACRRRTLFQMFDSIEAAVNIRKCNKD